MKADRPGTSRLRRAVRRRVGQVLHAVAERQARVLEPQLNAIRAELRETRQQLARATHDAEVRRRRDLILAGEIRALAETELFVAEHMTGVRRFAHPHATLDFALEQVSVSGMALEFGVAGGDTLRRTVAGLPGRETYGFDTFTGLPEHWRPGFRQGMFAQDALPSVPGATLVQGLFEQTLPGFLAEHPDQVAFLHLDADLYSSTTTVLSALGDRLVAGSIVVLDEYFNYPGWQDGEFRAWAEFVAATGLEFRYLGYTFNNEQVVVEVTRPAAVS